MKDEFFLVDTNILVYAYDKSDIKKHLICSKIIEKCWNEDVKYTISIQNLVEFFSIVTSKIKKPLDEITAKGIVDDIINFPNWIILNYNKTTIIRAINIKINNKTSFWDSLLIARMLENNVFNIYTENEKDFNKVNNINVVNPFS